MQTPMCSRTIHTSLQELAKSTKDALSQSQEAYSAAAGASQDQQYKQKKLLQDFAAILQVSLGRE